MKNIRFQELVADRVERCKNLLFKKGSDYDKIDTDRLSSFKKVAAIANILEINGFTGYTGSGVANILLILKQVRDANLKHSDRPPQNESRLDTIDDHHNYLDLMIACEEDEYESKEFKKSYVLAALEIALEEHKDHVGHSSQDQSRCDIIVKAIEEIKSGTSNTIL